MDDATRARALRLRSSFGVAYDATISEFLPLHINPRELCDLILTHGQEAEVRKAVRCPCIRPDTRSPRVGCASCSGLGWYYPANQREKTVVLMSNRNASSTRQPAGIHTTGTAHLTFLPPMKPGHRDLVVMCQDTHQVHEVLRRGQAEVTRSRLQELIGDRRTVPAPVVARETPLRYPSIDTLELVFYEVDGEPVEAREGLDYLLDGRRIEWLGDRGPAAGGTYTVRYTAPGAYVVHGAAPVHRSEWVNEMPWKVTAERLDRVGEEDLR